MVRGIRTLRKTQAVTHEGDARFSQNEDLLEFDDNLLPPAEELEKLQVIDASIIEWIMRTSKDEQDARLHWNNRTVALAEINNGRQFILDILKIISALVIVLFLSSLSAILIFKEHIITGSVFGGATLIACVGMFLDFRSKDHHK